ncbi:dorsalin-1-like [Orbicella faveolata]|uniref:dorsalin-1-like n=1 Tax=Orbicella faveolata TaxID=48498 RepID=UPI0009E40C73|nr:dorsalin-1-like [Orbicella faveolata]
MKMLYVFFLLFTSQFALASSFKIIKEQTENGMKTLLSEMRKTASESTKSNIHPFLTMEGQKVPSGASSVGHNQAKSLEDHAAVQLRGSSTKRTKRESPQSKADQAVNGCRKEDLLVNTSDLGLSAKFIRPESFNAYQCRGKCSLTQGNTFTLHSLLEAFVNKKGNKADGEGCCVPTKLRSLSVIYYAKEHGIFERRTFQDMIIEECGCY